MGKRAESGLNANKKCSVFIGDVEERKAHKNAKDVVVDKELSAKVKVFTISDEVKTAEDAAERKQVRFADDVEVHTDAGNAEGEMAEVSEAFTELLFDRNGNLVKALGDGNDAQEMALYSVEQLSQHARSLSSHSKRQFALSLLLKTQNNWFTRKDPEAESIKRVFVHYKIPLIFFMALSGCESNEGLETACLGLDGLIFLLDLVKGEFLPRELIQRSETGLFLESLFFPRKGSVRKSELGASVEELIENYSLIESMLKCLVKVEMEQETSSRVLDLLDLYLFRMETETVINLIPSMVSFVNTVSIDENRNSTLASIMHFILKLSKEYEVAKALLQNGIVETLTSLIYRKKCSSICYEVLQNLSDLKVWKGTEWILENYLVWKDVSVEIAHFISFTLTALRNEDDEETVEKVKLSLREFSEELMKSYNFESLDSRTNLLVLTLLQECGFEADTYLKFDLESLSLEDIDLFLGLCPELNQEQENVLLGVLSAQKNGKPDFMLKNLHKFLKRIIMNTGDLSLASILPHSSCTDVLIENFVGSLRHSIDKGVLINLLNEHQCESIGKTLYATLLTLHEQEDSLQQLFVNFLTFVERKTDACSEIHPFLRWIQIMKIYILSENQLSSQFKELIKNLALKERLLAVSTDVSENIKLFNFFMEFVEYFFACSYGDEVIASMFIPFLCEKVFRKDYQIAFLEDLEFVFRPLLDLNDFKSKDLFYEPAEECDIKKNEIARFHAKKAAMRGLIGSETLRDFVMTRK